MDSLFILAASAALIWYVRNTVFWVYLWQKKEYRLDRLLIHLFETAQGRNLLFSPISFLKWSGIALYVITIFNETTIALFHLYVTAIFVVEALAVFREILTGQFRRPEFTNKALSLLFFSVTTILGILVVPLVDKFFWLLLIDKLLFFIVGFFVFLHAFPTELYRDILVNRAMRKIRGHKDMMIIGIAGSYGKSSTKEFIAQVLEKKFSLVKTRRNQHTLSGIADVILKNITEKTQVFVVEMGAYGRGEIATLCYVTKPNIGILTGINDQHMSFFRSWEGNIATKNELIESLPQKGMTLFNMNDEQIKKLYEKTTIQKVGYGTHVGTLSGITASEIKGDKTSITFTVHLKGRHFTLKAPLLGEHNIINLLPAIYIADYFGMTQSEIRQRILHLRPLPNTMIRKMTKRGVTVIDDTFNSNPESIAAVVAYMKHYKKKRFFVLQPMIELGRNAGGHHRKIGKAIAKDCEVVLLTNKNYLSQIRKGIMEEKGKCEIIFGNTKKLTHYLLQQAKKGDIILCEGSEAKPVVDQLTS